MEGNDFLRKGALWEEVGRQARCPELLQRLSAAREKAQSARDWLTVARALRHTAIEAPERAIRYFRSDNDMTPHLALALRFPPSLGMLCSARCACMRVHQ